MINSLCVYCRGFIAVVVVLCVIVIGAIIISRKRNQNNRSDLPIAFKVQLINMIYVCTLFNIKYIPTYINSDKKSPWLYMHSLLTGTKQNNYFKNVTRPAKINHVSANYT